MPEIVEVKKYVDFINHYLHNNTIKQIKIIGGRYKKHGPFQGYKRLIKHLPITNAKAFSKRICYKGTQKSSYQLIKLKTKQIIQIIYKMYLRIL